MANEMGILIYDVPEGNKRLYYRLRTKIRCRAIRMSLSVYLMPWGQRDEMQRIIDDAKAETGQYAAVSMLKFDNSDEAEISRIARESLVREIKGVGQRLLGKIEKARESMKDIPDSYVSSVEKQLAEAEGLAVVFGLTQDIESVMESVRKIAIAEVDKYRAEFKLVVDESRGDTDAEERREPASEVVT